MTTMPFLEKFKIGQRLVFGFGAVLALLRLLAGLAGLQMSRMAASTNEFATNLVPSYEAEHDMTLQLTAMRRLEFRHVLAQSEVEKAKIEALYVAADKLLNDTLAM